MYLPRARIERATIAAATAWARGRGAPSSGRRSFCNWDEDSITMAVEAARDCLQDTGRESVRWLGFASTTAPFADRSNSGVVATALDLPEATTTIDSAARSFTLAPGLANSHLAKISAPAASLGPFNRTSGV